ncbi:hypothetical protein IWQ47_005131 [Aquimarina sp. EL_43]|uniref:hypothetical protein n=1 Tax=unclassified Aquimarina TaxID=2627091 RepID=UPI0018CB20F5|nr:MULTISPECIES: hypothetical protein [unclassified Aquimarina]MBG6133659.1 hypothetical protein [Aquimarina sp. EL_35]MBG6153870.1 hypothetical protein [Aquimarina sp. EL_32]MBG6172032.1 hypothetical protein [Aquimarina sp. EL_43]
MIRKEYKTSLIKLGKFLVIFLIVDFALGMISKQLFFSQETGKYARSTYAIQETNAKVLIFGSSHAHRHYVPEVIETELKKSCYNAGAEGQQLLYHMALQKMIIKRMEPELMILNIDEDFLYHTKEAYDRLSDLHPYYSDYRDDLKPILGLQSKLVDFKLFFRGYQTNSTIMHVIRYYASPQLDYKGYRPLFGKVKLSKHINEEVQSKIEKGVEDIDQNFVAALQMFIAIAKDHNIDLVFVTSPTYFTVDHSMNTSFNRIKTIAEKENIPFVDFFNDQQFMGKPTLFHDPSHLNNDGAKLFTKKLADQIKKFK